MQEFLSRCAQSVVAGDKDDAHGLARAAVAESRDLLRVIEEGFAVGVRRAGALFEEGEYFLPELAFSAEAMKAAMAVLQPELLAAGDEHSRGRVIIGTVQGDIHDIGKSLVATMLLANNYEVIDLGADVPHERFVDETRARQPDIVCMSALLTTTMPGQAEVVRLLESSDLRASVKVLVGGAPTSAQWARTIGADAHAPNAVAAARAADSLLARGGQ